MATPEEIERSIEWQTVIGLLESGLQGVNRLTAVRASSPVAPKVDIVAIEASLIEAKDCFPIVHNKPLSLDECVKLAKGLDCAYKLLDEMKRLSCIQSTVPKIEQPPVTAHQLATLKAALSCLNTLESLGRQERLPTMSTINTTRRAIIDFHKTIDELAIEETLSSVPQTADAPEPEIKVGCWIIANSGAKATIEHENWNNAGEWKVKRERNSESNGIICFWYPSAFTHDPSCPCRRVAAPEVEQPSEIDRIVEQFNNDLNDVSESVAACHGVRRILTYLKSKESANEH